MRQTFRQVWQYLWVRAALYALILLLAFWLLSWAFHGARSAVVTIALAFGFSYITSPIVRWFEKRRLTRALGVVVVFVGLLLFLAVASVLLANLIGQLTGFLNNLPNLISPLLNWFGNLPGRMGQIELPQPVRDALNQASSTLETLLQGFAQTLLRGLQALLAQGGNLIGFFTGILGGVFQLLTALTISLYLLYDLPKVGQTLFNTVPQPYQPLTKELAERADRAFGNYVRGQITVAALVGLSVAIGLSIVYGIFQGFNQQTFSQAFSLGFLAFIFNFIPYVGVIISSIPAILLALPMGWLAALGAGLALWLANQLEGNIYSPFIMRRAVSIHPVTGISAILIAGSLFGIVGALLAGPILAFLKILYTDYYLNSRFYREG
ncbi:MAG: AI-2E family transporter [Meiothermus sp.]